MAQMLLVNPRKRRKASAAKKPAAKRRSIASRARSSVAKVSKRIKHYRRNPISKASVISQFKEGAIGAAGALAVDVAMAKLPIPAEYKTGQFAPLVKGFVGIGIGMAVAKFGKNKKLGEQLAAGAVTVSLYNAGRQLLAPTLGLAGYGDGGLLGYDDQGLLGWDMQNDLGWQNSAQSFEDYEDLGYFETDLGQ